MGTGFETIAVASNLAATVPPVAPAFPAVPIRIFGFSEAWD
jgi:hypothetical protein